MNQEFNLDLGIGKIGQLGFVFKDIKKQAKIWEELLGVSKFSFIPAHTITCDYRGKRVDVTVTQGFSRCFDVQLELVEHIDGESYHKEFLDKGREGLHHISIFVDDVNNFIEKMTSRGIKLLAKGQRGKQSFVHFDTEESLGFILEAQETKSRRKKNKSNNK